ncbi:cas scaffolding protein family member 4 isoform X2 [Spea bombifrons]|uniref:cas scaffolding protein family member 4 isoform X2 n=1 Tax=Spea bombifrons TaxID=233779 RepID=UPI00234B02F0|nr:cas scaffolding protein family member 4 isoform X2 [Spea bombifrons]
MNKNMLAKALYDNKAECSDELAFRRGDILTVLEQNVFGSEGWWRCYLHGRQGLAPANRLQLFTATQNEILFTPSSYGSIRRQQSPQNIYQVPSAPKPENTAAYERMDSIYITPPSPNTGDIYQTPVSPEILYEKACSSSNQHLFTLPRATRASNPTTLSQQELYDTPPSKHCSPTSSQDRKTPSPVDRRSPVFSSSERIQQQIYDIPSSPDTPGRESLKEPKNANIYAVPPSGLHQKKRCETPPTAGNFNTLPNPRKSEWIYDIPVSPEKKDLKDTSRKISLDTRMVYDIPPTRYGSGAMQPKPDGNSPSQIYDIPPPMHIKSASADQTLYDVPAFRESLAAQQNGSLKKSSSSFGKVKSDQVDYKENIYDIPRGLVAPAHGKRETSSPVCNRRIYDVPPTLPRNFKLSRIVPNNEGDRLSVSSSESRTSTLSTSSSSSQESFTSSLSEDSSKEGALEHDVAIKTITQLQERVSTSIASLMIFVSSKWRLQEHMEANLEEIHRAVDSIILSLGMFVDFAQRIKANASRLTDSNIQLRINQQLLTLTDSLQTLSHNQEEINLCNWSLHKLVIKSHTTPDDLDCFVMVARTIPDDIKRFVSIIIANGKLLFRKQEAEKKPKSQREHLAARRLQKAAQDEAAVLQECITKVGESTKERRPQLPRQKAIEDCDYVHLQKKEEFEKMQNLSSDQLHENNTHKGEKKKEFVKSGSKPPVSKETEKKSEIFLKKESSPKQDTPEESPKKIPLSEHCHLYLGALQKAIGVFKGSLSTNQPPEVFITHGKLIIMVGQKLVDYLCQDAKDNESRNDVLHKSSELCSLLKNLAMATKTAAIQYPNTAATQEAHRRTDELSDYAQLFRSMVE